MLRMYNDNVLCNGVCDMHTHTPLDYEKVITYYMRQYKYQEALRVLRTKGLEALEAPEKVRVPPFFSNFVCLCIYAFTCIYMYMYMYTL